MRARRDRAWPPGRGEGTGVELTAIGQVRVSTIGRALARSGGVSGAGADDARGDGGNGVHNEGTELTETNGVLLFLQVVFFVRLRFLRSFVVNSVLSVTSRRHSHTATASPPPRPLRTDR